MRDFQIINGVLAKYRGHETHVVIPDGVRTIRKGAFGGIPGLTVRGKNGTAAKQYALGEQIAFEEKTEIFIRDGILVYCSGLPSHFAVPDTVTTISPLAFQGCDSLVSVTIPGRVKQIPNGLFKGHASLQSVIFPDSVERIGALAFRNCSELKSVVLPGNLKRIGEGAFYGCRLREVTIPASVTFIELKAFSYWYSFYEHKGNLIIRGKKGSDAERYARENRSEFRSLGV